MENPAVPEEGRACRDPKTAVWKQAAFQDFTTAYFSPFQTHQRSGLLQENFLPGKRQKCIKPSKTPAHGLPDSV